MVKIGAIIGIIGGALVAVAGILLLSAMATLERALQLAAMTWADIGVNPTMFYVCTFVTLAMGAIGIVGAILSFKDKKIGAILMLATGAFAGVGQFIPIVSVTVPPFIVLIPLVTSLFIADPFILMVGGILGLAIKSE